MSQTQIVSVRCPVCQHQHRITVAWQTLSEEQRIALGLRPRTLAGVWFWLRHWSPPALALLKWRRRWPARPTGK